MKDLFSRSPLGVGVASSEYIEVSQEEYDWYESILIDDTMPWKPRFVIPDPDKEQITHPLMFRGSKLKVV